MPILCCQSVEKALLNRLRVATSILFVVFIGPFICWINLVTLSIETNYCGIHKSAGKRIDYINFLEKEYIVCFANMVTRVDDSEQSGI